MLMWQCQSTLIYIYITGLINTIVLNVKLRFYRTFNCKIKRILQEFLNVIEVPSIYIHNPCIYAIIWVGLVSEMLPIIKDKMMKKVCNLYFSKFSTRTQPWSTAKRCQFLARRFILQMGTNIEKGPVCNYIFIYINVFSI